MITKPRKHRTPSKPRLVKCVACPQEFITRHSQGRYCSRKCRKEGERASWRQYGARNPDLRQRNARASYIRNRDAVLERTREYQKTNVGKLVAATSETNQRDKWPERIFARHALRAAVKAGYIIPQPCFCGKKAQAHHPNYLEPFIVVWLCVDHHVEEHRRIKAEGISLMGDAMPANEITAE